MGGTGANFIQTLIKSERFSRLMASEDFQMACLAVDVADADLSDLQQAYTSALSKLKSKGIPLDRLWVKAVNLKFDNPDSLFEFLAMYDEYLRREGVVLNNYQPWISTSMSIPPLAGGAGRMRALSKAVYNLNYYYYQEVNNALSVFKDKVLTAKKQPVVVVVFGLGGGTGSGMVFDFTRNLRSKLGSAVPIIGLCVLPSTADDLLARGPAPYTSLMEGELLFNKGLNDKVAKKFGEAYRNPFTSLFFVPLDPVYNSKSNLLLAKEELDESLVDILHIFSSFDLADLLSQLGTNNDFGPNWVHSMTYLKVRYPVDDYVNYFHEYLQLFETVGKFMAVKKAALLGINGIFRDRFEELKEFHRRYRVSTNRYAAETFDKDVEETVHHAGRYDAEYKKQVKGLEDFAFYYCDGWSKVWRAMVFPADSTEYAVVRQLVKWSDEISSLGRSHEQFAKEFAPETSELEQNVTASKLLTSSQIRQIRAFIAFADLIGTSLETLDLYIRAKAMAEEVSALYPKEKSRSGVSLDATLETELSPLFKAAGYILARPETEDRVSDQYIPGVRVVKKRVDASYKEAVAVAESTGRLLAQKEPEMVRLKKELQKFRLDVSGKKKMMRRSLETLESDVAALKVRQETQAGDSERLRAESERLGALESILDMTSEYWRILNGITTKSSEINEIMSGITHTGNYYERVVELSEAEQVKIVERILREEEAVLKGEGILKEIVDKERFRSTVKGYLRVFSVGNYAGLSESYRSDMIWATVGIPGGLWDQELQGSLSNSLNAFSSVEASKSISIKQLSQIDPWTITFIVIFAKARPDQIEKYTSMRSETEALDESEKVLFRSFLLEQGRQGIEEITMQMEKAEPTPPRGR